MKENEGIFLPFPSSGFFMALPSCMTGKNVKRADSIRKADFAVLDDEEKTVVRSMLPVVSLKPDRFSRKH